MENAETKYLPSASLEARSAHAYNKQYHQARTSAHLKQSVHYQ